jgi:hypothetical protein
VRRPESNLVPRFGRKISQLNRDTTLTFSWKDWAETSVTMAVVPARFEPSTPRIRAKSFASMPARFVLFQTMNMLHTEKNSLVTRAADRKASVLKTARTLETPAILSEWRFLVASLVPSSQMPGWHLDYATTASFQVLYNSSFIHHLTIWSCLLKASLFNRRQRQRTTRSDKYLWLEGNGVSCLSV